MHPTHEPTGTDTVQPDDSPAAILRHAALYLDRHGWTWGVRYELPHPDAPQPAADVVGAVRIAVVGHPVADGYTEPDQAALVGRALGTLAAYLELNHRSAVEVLTEWNDNVPTNTTQVITLLWRAADWQDDQAGRYSASFVARLLGSAAGR